MLRSTKEAALHKQAGDKRGIAESQQIGYLLFTSHSLESTPMGGELQKLLKEGDGCILASCSISLENMPTTHIINIINVKTVNP